MSICVLLVEPNNHLRAQLLSGANAFGRIDVDTDFNSARKRLFSSPYDWVVTNIRLDAYNGLHLLHLAAMARLRARILVYSDPQDAALAREAQRAGAFYEPRRSVHLALHAYLRGVVPRQDRRNAHAQDRRRVWRSGRRCSDSPGLPLVAERASRFHEDLLPVD
jgi:DNA-binding NarL/FixJ family response regulator